MLELLAVLGPAAADFIVACAKGIKFAVPNVRGTKDVDFILNAIALREESVSREDVLKKLGCTAVVSLPIMRWSLIQSTFHS